MFRKTVRFQPLPSGNPSTLYWDPLDSTLNLRIWAKFGENWNELLVVSVVSLFEESSYFGHGLVVSVSAMVQLQRCTEPILAPEIAWPLLTSYCQSINIYIYYIYIFIYCDLCVNIILYIYI